MSVLKVQIIKIQFLEALDNTVPVPLTISQLNILEFIRVQVQVPDIIRHLNLLPIQHLIINQVPLYISPHITNKIVLFRPLTNKFKWDLEITTNNISNLIIMTVRKKKMKKEILLTNEKNTNEIKTIKIK